MFFRLLMTFIKNNLEALIVNDRIDSFVAKRIYRYSKKLSFTKGLIDCIEEITFYRNLDPLLFLRTDFVLCFDLKFEQ